MNKNLIRDELVRREDYMKRTFGENSQQRHDIREEILRLNDMMLRERANKVKEFLDVNNERATKAFCRLSKEGGLCDDTTQIRDESGNIFRDKKGRESNRRGIMTTCIKDWTTF
jgi:hypothetical protein